MAGVLALAGLLLLALFWGLYMGTPATEPCVSGSGTCPAQLPSLIHSPLVLAPFAAGYLAILGAMAAAFPSRLLYGLMAVGLLAWVAPALFKVAAGSYGEISVLFFLSFMAGAGAHVSMPAALLKTAMRELSLGLYPVLGVGAAGLVLLLLSQVAGDLAPAPLVGSLFAFWGFGALVAAIVNQPWKLVK